MAKGGPIRPPDDEARALARALIDGASFAALGVIDPGTGAPFVTRIALGSGPQDGLVSLVSALSAHTRALHADPACSLLVGEPGPKGDPLTHPRLTLTCHARFVAPGGETHGRLRAMWLACHPKAKLYVDFGDFAFIRFAVHAGHLNGGFGRAFRLAPADLGL